MGVLMLRPLMLRGEFGLYGAVKSCGAGNLLLINVSYLLEEASLKEMVKPPIAAMHYHSPSRPRC